MCLTLFAYEIDAEKVKWCLTPFTQKASLTAFAFLHHSLGGGGIIGPLTDFFPPARFLATFFAAGFFFAGGFFFTAGFFAAGFFDTGFFAAGFF